VDKSSARIRGKEKMLFVGVPLNITGDDGRCGWREFTLPLSWL